MPQKQRAAARAGERTPSVFRTADVARLLGIRPRRVRDMARAGLCQPGRRGRLYQFSFQDIVLLRTAHGLSQAGVRPERIKRALGQLKRQLPPERPISGMRIVADGRGVAVREGRRAWEPESGQQVFVFDVEQLAHETRVLVPASSRRAPRGAQRRDAESALDWFNRGVALEAEDERAARAAYRRAIEIDPELGDAYVNLGRLHQAQRDLRTAIDLYRQALQRLRDDPVVHYNIALALEDARDTDTALAHYHHAIRLDPGFADAHYNLGRLLETIGRHDQALQHLLAYRRLTKGK
jgi:tetratricopeptide (TPR) repeat protein